MCCDTNCLIQWQWRVGDSDQIIPLRLGDLGVSLAFDCMLQPAILPSSISAHPIQGCGSRVYPRSYGWVQGREWPRTGRQHIVGLTLTPHSLAHSQLYTIWQLQFSSACFWTVGDIRRRPEYAEETSQQHGKNMHFHTHGVGLAPWSRRCANHCTIMPPTLSMFIIITQHYVKHEKVKTV